jgi:hypothetical protein
MSPVANWRAKGCWGCDKTLTEKPPDWVKASKLLAALRMLHKTKRGSKDTEAKELQVMPQSLSCQRAVTTVTPVAKHDRALR